MDILFFLTGLMEFVWVPFSLLGFGWVEKFLYLEGQERFFFSCMRNSQSIETFFSFYLKTRLVINQFFIRLERSYNPSSMGYVYARLINDVFTMVEGLMNFIPVV